MALDPSTADPCSLLNVVGYPTLWLTANEADNIAYPKISIGSLTNTYLSALTSASKSMNVLSSQQPTSTFRLVQFLSGGGVASGAKKADGTTIQYGQLGDVALKRGNTYETIVDTYIVGSTWGIGKTGYTYSTPNAPILTDLNIWTSTDTSTTHVSVLGKLLAAGYLLSAGELFTKEQLEVGATSPSSGTESLVYLYKQDQSNAGLTVVQKTRKATLEARNLRFFGAFLCEYCYYRTRYEWLLAKYFTIYTTPGTGVNAFSAATNPAGVVALFSGKGTGETQYEGDQPKQAEMLKGLAYQMACLNTRMTDMRRLLGAINTYYNGVFTTIQTRLNDASLVGSNSELTKTIQSLQASASDANGYLSQTEFTKSVMEYNSEKNRYSNILLGLYAFLNIAALATVFQLARTS
jgi:hypothetical protein